MLKMKKSCEKCSVKLELLGVAYICSYECTFCETCSVAMTHICPNCDGDLVVRPTRKASPLSAGVTQARRKLFGSKDRS